MSLDLEVLARMHACGAQACAKPSRASWSLDLCQNSRLMWDSLECGLSTMAWALSKDEYQEVTLMLRKYELYRMRGDKTGEGMRPDFKIVTPTCACVIQAAHDTYSQQCDVGSGYGRRC